MAAFVQEYSALRWLAVAAFALAAVIVLRRLAAVRPAAVVAHNGIRVIDPESDAAHLLMCLVMLAMLVFPAAASPRALSGVLTAMTVVYALLLAGRILQRRDGPPRAAGAGGDSAGADARGSGEAEAGDSVMAFAYHVVAAAAMLYAMSGHTGGMVHTAPEPAPMLALAALFLADALAMAVPGSRQALRHMFPHPIGSAGPVAVLPHVVMDLGTAYMLVAAAVG
ncbi:DUF5134 domain-containing protein [Nocardia huaxiensis]|uniref:DUF5134 domain-containing protein n=1 Tax=Nocardia huaxiensis TaxID=2755382 RepID=A0A7D6V981_9NOCA|nr:DUF5134 domain-containing protein [Nocardia huaxiensis]QLY29493.1 DUF5134 domain-containing protein [Nocardia huaxiensis]UFS96951.1 DUF5134 domain-containing protein [Nocardia huaxiensis]